MSYKISIIVPNYKTELYIHKCIDSILSQTFKEFELILVDDGSPDRCGEICDEYAKNDCRIKVIHKENGGYSSAINAGLGIAEGEYIGIVDGDDYIDRGMYEALYNLAREYDADVVECNYYKVEKNNIYPARKSAKIQVGDNLFALGRFIKGDSRPELWSKIYKKELFADLRLPYGKIYSDAFIVLKILYILKKYVYTGDCKYFYVQREGSVMSQKAYSIKKLESMEFEEERFYFLKDKLNDKSILNLLEYRYFENMFLHYINLCNNKELDTDKKYREMIRKKILVNYYVFKKNRLLDPYKKWMMLIKINGTLFEVLFGLYEILISHRCILFVKKRILRLMIKSASQGG